VTTLLTARFDSPIQEIQMPGDRFRAVGSALETAVPADVLSSDLFRNRGVPEISQALSAALPF
jgi:hypothetical protein